MDKIGIQKINEKYEQSEVFGFGNNIGEVLLKSTKHAKVSKITIIRVIFWADSKYFALT